MPRRRAHCAAVNSHAVREVIMDVQASPTASTTTETSAALVHPSTNGSTNGGMAPTSDLLRGSFHVWAPARTGRNSSTNGTIKRSNALAAVRTPRGASNRRMIEESRLLHRAGQRTDLAVNR